MTTQACERVYKAQPTQTGQIVNHLTVDAQARLNWLPQETILFNGGALDRKLLIDLAPDATALMVEPLIFGRAAMGETLTDIRFRDRIEIRRDKTPVFMESIRFSGDLNAHLTKRFIANNAGAMALVVLASGTAEAHLNNIRKSVPESAGASLVSDGILVVRVLAATGFELRRSLLPIVQQLNGSIPRCWTI